MAGIKFDKTMRWNTSGIAFSRPIRWFLALFGQQVIPFSYAGLNSSRVTRGLRFNDPQEIEINHPAEYFDVLAKQGILLNAEERKQEIARQVAQLQRETGAAEDVDPALLAEVVQLVEVTHCPARHL